MKAEVKRRRLFTVDEYYRMAEAGILHEDDRVELIDGEILLMSPIGTRHSACVDFFNEEFRVGLGRSVIVRVQNPIRLPGQNEPEPDIVIVRPRPDRYRRSHPEPADIFLVIEVSDSSLAYDREKVADFAAAGIPEAWIANVNAEEVEVNRDPGPDGYRTRFVLSRGGTVTPLAFPDLSLRIDDIFG